MNKQRMLELADVIEQQPRKKFWMAAWFSRVVKGQGHVEVNPDWDDENDELLPEGKGERVFARQLPHTCDTAGCIAGWAVALHPNAGLKQLGHYYFVEEHGRAILGLTPVEGSCLFFEGMKMTPEQAAKRIREAVEIGTVLPCDDHGKVDRAAWL